MTDAQEYVRPLGPVGRARWKALIRIVETRQTFTSQKACASALGTTQAAVNKALNPQHSERVKGVAIEYVRDVPNRPV